MRKITDNMIVEFLLETRQEDFLKKGTELTREFLEYIQKQNLKFNFEQRKMIQEGFRQHLTINQIKTYAYPSFKADAMKEIMQGFLEELTMEEVSIYAEFFISAEKMREIRFALKNKVPTEMINLFIKPIFNSEQIYEISMGFKNGLTDEQIRVYAAIDDWKEPLFSNSEMKEIREGFEHELTMQQVQVYAKKIYEFLQMRQIRLAFEHGLVMEQVSVLSNPKGRKLNSTEMSVLREALEAGMCTEQARKLVKQGEFDIYKVAGAFIEKMKMKEVLKSIPEE